MFKDDVVRAFLESGGAGLLGPLLEEESDHVRFEASRLIAQLCKDGPKAITLGYNYELNNAV